SPRDLHSFPTTTLFRSIETIASEDHARYDRDASNLRERCCARPKRCPLEQRASPVANPPLRENADDPPVFQPFDCGANRFEIRRSEEHTSELQSRFDLV